MNVYDYIDSGFKVFGLHGAKDGLCNCGNPECKALFKHPIISNWQRVPLWADEQIETMEEMGQFKTGFGVLCDGILVVDVDPRNGGEIPAFLDASQTFTVATGGGGFHLYYRLASNLALLQHHPQHMGVDFKTSGFVVGCGSIHASGAMYEALHGHPSELLDAPPELLELLKRPDTFRAQTGGSSVDVSLDDVEVMLSHIDPDVAYEEWVKVGMAIHHVMGGTGFAMWDDWSRKGRKYTGIDSTEKRWHSFGKSANPAGIGTLVFLAEKGGYSRPVEFVSSVTFSDPLTDLDDIDLCSPVGFVGDLTRWVNSQCLYPRENIAVAVALQAIGSIAGTKYTDATNGITSNLFTFCIAGSGTGKEAVQGAYAEILRAVDMQNCLYGGIKSEQELIRNLARNPTSVYSIDELGIMLGKVKNASKSGAHYLEGLLGTCMSIYSKAGGFFIPNGDLKEDLKNELKKEAAAVQKELDKTGKGEEKLQAILQQLETIDSGIKSPFLSISGYTTPVTFDHLVDFEQATNGFIARTILFQDLETNPRRKRHNTKHGLPDALRYVLAGLAAKGDQCVVETEKDAMALLDDVYEYFWQMAEDEKSRTGLEAICRRGYEICAKVSFILAIPAGIRTAQDVRWAFALAKRDINTKIQLAYSNMSEVIDPSDDLAIRIQKLISRDHGEPRSVIINRLKNTSRTKEAVIKTIEALLGAGYIEERLDDGSRKKTPKLYIK